MFADLDEPFMEEPPKPVSVAKPRAKTRRTSERTGLSFPVARIQRNLQHERLSRCGKPPAIFMAAVLEYLTKEVLEEAGVCAKELKRHRITPRHINLVIKSDDEFNTLMRKTIISGGGVYTKLPELAATE
jgi:histone H2A